MSMCRVLRVQRSGYYAWQASPKSQRSLDDETLTVQMRQLFDDSQGVYGNPRIHRDLREAAVPCGKKRVARLMHSAKLQAQRGYKRPRYRVGKPAVAAPNRLQRQFTVAQPDRFVLTRGGGLVDELGAINNYKNPSIFIIYLTHSVFSTS